MQVRFNTLTLQNYKCHRELEVKFGDLTKITADNAKGKSSIPESVSWLFYGTDALGGKTDPTPITYAAEETLVQLLLSVDEKQLLLGRGLKKGKVQYYINEVPSKAGEFNEVIEQMFEKELFLSLFNPSYFFTLHWEKQRAMLLQYVSAPARKDVLKSLPEAVGSTLEKYLKKHSLDDLEKIHKENKTKKDKAHTAAEGGTKKLKQQLEYYAPMVALDSLKAEYSVLSKKKNDIEAVLNQANLTNSKIDRLLREIDFLKDKRDQFQNQKRLIKVPVDDTCSSCGQNITDELKERVIAEQQARWDLIKPELKEVIDKRKQIESEVQALSKVDVTKEREKLQELTDKLIPVEKEMEKHKEYARLSKVIEQAEEEEKELLRSLNASIFILDSIKAFRGKEAELQGEKVQALFTTLSIKLFEELKNGEMKPSFEIEMDGKGYRKLSLSEGIRAGLELRDVLSQQSELITPCFVDNAESITSFKQPNGQLIISRVVAGQELEINHD